MTKEQDDATKHRIGIANERARLLANALDRASTACITVGILAPAAAFLYGVPATPASSIVVVVSGAFAWLGAATALHLIARAVLGSIR